MTIEELEKGNELINCINHIRSSVKNLEKVLKCAESVEFEYSKSTIALKLDSIYFDLDLKRFSSFVESEIKIEKTLMNEYKESLDKL